MTETMRDLSIAKSLELLRDGFKRDFATFAYNDMRMTELFHELSVEFVDANIPIIDDDNQIELSIMLMESLDIVSR